jgi:thioredoxin-related protein
MGVFRQHDRGSLYAAITDTKSKGEEAIALPSKGSLQLCEILDRHFDYRYRRAIRKQKAYWYWVGAIEYAQYGRKDVARAWLLKAIPHFFPMPHWLSFKSLLTNLPIILLPASFIRVLRSVKALIR